MQDTVDWWKPLNTIWYQVCAKFRIWNFKSFHLKNWIRIKLAPTPTGYLIGIWIRMTNSCLIHVLNTKYLTKYFTINTKMKHSCLWTYSICYVHYMFEWQIFLQTFSFSNTPKHGVNCKAWFRNIINWNFNSTSSYIWIAILLPVDNLSFNSIQIHGKELEFGKLQDIRYIWSK